MDRVMQINIVNIDSEELDYLLSRIGVIRHLGALYHTQSRQDVGTIESTHLEIDFQKIKKLEIKKIGL
jgi:hypothetical protein